MDGQRVRNRQPDGGLGLPPAARRAGREDAHPGNGVATGSSAILSLTS